MAPFVSLIHGVDSLKLLEEINKQAQKNNRIIDCLLQMYIAEEESKFGLDEDELREILTSTTFQEMKNIRIVGLMGMATFTDNQEQIKKEFTHLKIIFDKNAIVADAISADTIGTDTIGTDAINRVSTWQTISMGMSGDYKLAIDCGSTMVRIGSSIFGGRI
jgi:pyridoxal phosphate enzyme (YggS family)